MKNNKLFYRLNIAKYSKTLGQILYINIIVKIALYLYVFSQMFIVYDALAEPSLKRMNNIVDSAVCILSSEANATLCLNFSNNIRFQLIHL